MRTGWNALRLLHSDGSAFDLFATLAAQTTQEGEVRVRVDEGTKAAEPLSLRLVARRKSPEEAKVEQKRLLKEAKKRGKKPDPRTLEAAKYILLLTSLPTDVFSTADVLALYRFRWQLELAFKRMKSLARLDELAAKKPELARAWIYARLIAFLIAEQSAGQVPESPPSEPSKTSRRKPSRRKPVTLAPRQNSPRQSPRCHSRILALATRSQRLHAHSPSCL